MDYNNDYGRMSQILRDSWDKMSEIMFESSDINVKKLAQGFCDEIERYLSICKRRTNITSSVQKKPIKSAFGETAVFEIMDDKLMDARRNIRSCISINPRKELDNELQNIDGLIGDALTHTEMVKNGDYDNHMSPVNNSRKPIKSSVRDDFADRLNELMKHYSLSFSSGSLENNMTDIYDNYVSQYYADELEEKGGKAVATDWFHNTYPDNEEGIFINNSRKPIKSSLEDRLIPYLEEFEEGFADAQVVAPGDEMDIPSHEETFFEIFKNDYNLSDEDIDKLKDAVINIWEDTAGD